MVGVANDLAFRWTARPRPDIARRFLGWDRGERVAGRFAGWFTTIVGFGTVTAGRVAFRWTQTTGMVNLGTLPGATFSIADAVSADGSVIVGTSTSTAFIWDTTHGMQNLKTDLIANYGLGSELQGWQLTEAIFGKR